MLTDKQIRRGVHRSVEELEAAITAFLDKHNAVPKPFRWIQVGGRHPRRHRAIFRLDNTSPS